MPFTGDSKFMAPYFFAHLIFIKTKAQTIASTIAYGNPHERIAQIRELPHLCTPFGSGGKGELKRDKMMHCRSFNQP
jgi:hypothetical protein